MTKVQFEIKSCRECPFFKSDRMYTADSWEHAFDWFCKKMDNKQIAGYVERESEANSIPIPEWCPIKLES